MSGELKQLRLKIWSHKPPGRCHWKRSYDNLFQRISISRSGGTAAAPAQWLSFCAGRSDGDPSNFVHRTNSTSNLVTNMPRVSIISCLAKNRPGHMETPPPICTLVSLLSGSDMRLSSSAQLTVGDEIVRSASHDKFRRHRLLPVDIPGRLVL